MKIKLHKVTKKIIPNTSTTVFDLTVKDDHSYTANSFMVHNCGYPQLAAVAVCAEAGPVIADGGIRTPGDAAKALAAGARAVMVGGMLAGTDCVPGWGETSYLSYRGMASNEARQSFTGEPASNAEGVSTIIKGKPEGSTEAVVNDIVEGVRSAMSYAGARSLQEFYSKARLIRVDATVAHENSPHFTSS